MAAKVTTSKRTTSITYSASVTNTGSAAADGIVFTEHVPAGTTWKQGGGCGQNALPVSVSYNSGSKSTVCVAGKPPEDGSDDSSVHQVTLTLQSLAPSESARVEVTFVVDAQTASVSNHCHAAVTGVTFDSQPVVTRFQ
jgi:molecular chaperone DnaK (HSP70)